MDYMASGLSTPISAACSAQSCGTRSFDSGSVERYVSEVAMNSIVRGAVAIGHESLPAAPSQGGTDRPDSGLTMTSGVTQSTNQVCAEDVVEGLFTLNLAQYADSSRPVSGQSHITMISNASQSTNEFCAAGMVERIMESELMIATAGIDPGTELLRQKLLSCMMDAVSSGTLDSHLQAAVQGRPKKDLEEVPQTLTASTSAETLPRNVLAKPLSTGAASLMLAVQSVSSRDRRIGELQATIRERERAHLQRDASIAALQERLFALNADKAHLDLDVKWHKTALESATDRSSQLAASQRQLKGDLDLHNMKMRHACIESDPLLFSSRSDFSTTAGTGFAGTGFAGTGFMHTPRSPLHAVLEPIANR